MLEQFSFSRIEPPVLQADAPKVTGISGPVADAIQPERHRAVGIDDFSLPGDQPDPFFSGDSLGDIGGDAQISDAGDVVQLSDDPTVQCSQSLWRDIEWAAGDTVVGSGRVTTNP